MTLTKAGEVFQHSLIHRPRFLSLTLSRSKKAGEGQELAGEHPYPYDDYEAGARRR